MFDAVNIQLLKTCLLHVSLLHLSRKPRYKGFPGPDFLLTLGSLDQPYVQETDMPHSCLYWLFHCGYTLFLGIFPTKEKVYKDFHTNLLLHTFFMENWFLKRSIWPWQRHILQVYLDPNEMSGRSYLCTCSQTVLLAKKENRICTLLTHR